ncbi:MAG: GNAT family N-acetyltransferase [Micropepsaceae bacterium]
MAKLAHFLDRPIWHALNQHQSTYAIGGERARRFMPEVGLFAATCDDAPDALAALADLVRNHGPAVLLQVGDIPVPAGTTVQMTMLGVQMVAHNIEPLDPTPPVERLTATDAPAMLALATATQPGPFFARTHELGTFWGVKVDGRLVAMAGERMKLPGYTEVSAVCTDPAHRGKGYAGLLSRIVATQILSRGETPILHAYASNTPAVRLYEQLGFELRTNVNVALLVRV